MIYWFKVKRGLLAVAITVVACLVAGSFVAAESTPITDEITNGLDSLQAVPEAIKSVSPPKTPQPKWYQEQVAAEQAAARAVAQTGGSSNGSRVITYTISTKGATRSNLAEFAAQADETLNDKRGWAQLGITFRRVSSGGQFNLILSEASQVPSFAPGACSAQWSCRVGISVIINDDRWQGATLAWNNAGGSLRDYRHMVINHEVGHWLGHDHAACSAPGSYAPVMLQQSIDLQGCKFNPWPLASELWTSR